MSKELRCLVCQNESIDDSAAPLARDLRMLVRERLMAAGLKIVDINALYERAISLTGVPKPIEFTDKIVGVIRYRDGSVIDTVRQVKEDV